MATPSTTPTQTTPVSSKSLGKGIAIVITIIMAIIMAFYLLSRPSKQEMQVAGSGTIIIAVNAERESPTIPLVDAHGKALRITYGILSDTTPYIIHCNGGKGKEGGFDSYIPARTERSPGWKISTEGENRTVFLTFQLPAGYKPASLSYTLSRKD
jgi:hypothetical protein